MVNIDSLANWGPAVNVNTSRGPRSLRVAAPGGVFWKAWGSSKPELQAAGVSCRKDRNGNWEACHWADVSAEEVPAREPNYPAGAQVVPAQERGYPLPAFRAMEHAAKISNDMKWSDEQQAIFAHFKNVRRNLVVRARAGTGKTTTIKVAFSFAPENSMLYAVFNKKNQKEAAAAISDPRVEVKTLHSVGYMFIKQVWAMAKPDDAVERARAQVACGASAPDEAVAAVMRLVGFAKNLFVSPSVEDLVDVCEERGIECEAYEDLGWVPSKLAACALKVLALSLEPDVEGRISFNDMVWLPVAADWVHAWYDLVCIDEAQDMNLPQLLMARRACKPDGRVIVVGDDRQAIYGFRGAAQDGMNMMVRELNAVELGLTITYRCPKSVVALASKIVPDYRAADAAPEGEVLDLSVNVLQSSVAIGDAILSRANAPLMPICLSLLRSGVAARIEGRDIGKQLLGIVNSLRAKSVPHFIARVGVWGNKMKGRVRNSEQAEARISMINDQMGVLIAVAEGVSSVDEIKVRLQNLFQDSDGFNKPAVVLSSVHKAKGLEWGRVYLLRETFKRAEGLVDGEEANIYYVAMTRAKRSLVMVHGDTRPEERENE